MVAIGISILTPHLIVVKGSPLAGIISVMSFGTRFMLLNNLGEIQVFCAPVSINAIQLSNTSGVWGKETAT